TIAVHGGAHIVGQQTTCFVQEAFAVQNGVGVWFFLDQQVRRNGVLTHHLFAFHINNGISGRSRARQGGAGCKGIPACRCDTGNGHSQNGQGFGFTHGWLLEAGYWAIYWLQTGGCGQRRPPARWGPGWSSWYECS